MSTRVSLAAVAAYLAATADAHSWIACSDYRGDNRYYEPSMCFGHPRPAGGLVPAMTAFGVDIGFNEQPEEVVDGVSKCNTPDTTYLADYPQARYRQGQQVTLAWPSKNHVAAKCTSQYIPDTSLELFIAEYSSDHPMEYQQVKASFSDDPHVKDTIDFKGFQNCPAFCENMDKSLCTGTFIVPTDLPDGRYTFQWKWEFNAGTAPYVTCFEAYVGKDVPVVTTTKAPTVEGASVAPTLFPTVNQDADCVGEWGQCAGGGIEEACCPQGTQCFRLSEYYSQCRSDCPNDWECNPDAGKETPTPTYRQSCRFDYGVEGQLKKASDAAAATATLESGCDCAKFCTIFAPGKAQFSWSMKNGKCSCYGKAGNLKTNGKKKTVVAGSLPLEGFAAEFNI